MRFLVTGGGTGGHIYPAIAVLKEMQSLLPATNVLYVGTAAGMERAIVQKEGISFEAVRSAGVAGKSPAAAAKGLSLAAAGVWDALTVLRRFRPDVVLGTGGYVSGPVVLAAWMLRIPRAVQEQNAIPGKTNQILSRISNRTFCGWEQAVDHLPPNRGVMVTGNPVRRDLFGMDKAKALAFFGFDERLPTMLLLGGSRGARTLVDAGQELVRSGQAMNMIFITGKEYYRNVVESLGARAEDRIDGARTGNIIIQPYVYNMTLAYGAADLVLGRAGGMTLSEILALGLPAVIVPSPNVANDHQTFNARALETQGAAVVVEDHANAETAADIAKHALRLLNDESARMKMRDNSRRAGKPQAARVICRELIRLGRGSG